MPLESSIYVLSDATGETAEKIVMAALSQFRDHKARIKRFTNVRDKTEVYNVLDQAVQERALVCYTIVDTSLARIVHDECDALGLAHLDIMTPLLMRFAEFFGRSPRKTPGLLHDVNEDYFRRIEAVEFAVRNDDGQETRFLHKADIVLVGVSRTSKTPLSIYLAHRGWRVANIPLVAGIDPPKELAELPPGHVVGLLIDAERLMELRAARLQNMGQNPRTAYADYEAIHEELRQAKAMYRRNNWPIINVTGKAVEETATEILGKLKLK